MLRDPFHFSRRPIWAAGVFISIPMLWKKDEGSVEEI